MRSDGVSKVRANCHMSQRHGQNHAGIYGINAHRASGPHLIGTAADLPPFHRVCKSRPRAVACVWRRVRARPGRVELPRCRTSPSPCRCKRNLSGAGANQRPPNLLVWYDSPSEHNLLASLLEPPSVSARPPSSPLPAALGSFFSSFVSAVACSLSRCWITHRGRLSALRRFEQELGERERRFGGIRSE